LPRTRSGSRPASSHRRSAPKGKPPGPAGARSLHRLMRPSDRPVIAEPEERPVSPPLRIRLGQIVHLNGAVPRDLPLENATPRRCRTCSALFFVVGKGSNRAAFCQECRAKKCPSCNHAGGTHYAYCSSVKPRPCRGCSVELGHGGSLSPYCETCRAEQCPECRTYGGRHGKKCLYERRRRRPGLTTVRSGSGRRSSVTARGQASWRQKSASRQVETIKSLNYPIK
jgi:hypothetical protein